jgi:2-methylcitrate dehydratase PrpD
VALLDGAAGLAQYEDACVTDPTVRALRARVAVEEDEGIPVESARVTLRLDDGSSLTEYLRHGRGTPGRPMSEDALDAKVHDPAAFGAPEIDARFLIAAFRAIETAADVAGILRLTVPARG